CAVRVWQLVLAAAREEKPAGTAVAGLREGALEPWPLAEKHFANLVRGADQSRLMPRMQVRTKIRSPESAEYRPAGGRDTLARRSAADVEPAILTHRPRPVCRAKPRIGRPG